jgi:hypothetical protein
MGNLDLKNAIFVSKMPIAISFSFHHLFSLLATNIFFLSLNFSNIILNTLRAHNENTLTIPTLSIPFHA